MAETFNLTDLLTDVSKSAANGAKSQSTTRSAADNIVKLSVFDLVPSDDNFYSMNDIEELKSKIELAGKVLQNLVVVPLDGGKYKVISGHRRRLASISLVQKGKPEYEFVPCIIEANESDAEVQAIREEIMLIAANSQREKTAWDKIEETRRTRALLDKVKQKEKLPGDMRKHVAKALNTSPSQIGRYDAIIKNLCPEFMEELKQDRINISVAYVLSGLSEEEQKRAFEEHKIDGGVSIEDAKQKKRTLTNKVNQENQPSQFPPLPGQMDFDGNTFEEGKPKAEPPMREESTEWEPEHKQPPADFTPPSTTTRQNPELPDSAKPEVLEEAGTLKMYRVENNYIDGIFGRAYCVAYTEEQARSLAEAQFCMEAKDLYPEEYWKHLTLELLCDDISQGFCGDVSDVSD